MADECGLDKLVHLVRTYSALDGQHIQSDVVDAAMARAAEESLDRYRDLIVRVVGYSDYFCDLSRALQDEIIARSEHQSFDSAKRRLWAVPCTQPRPSASSRPMPAISHHR